MSAPQKLRGGSDSALTALKKLWRDSLHESAREYWRQLFVSDSTQAAVRKEIFAKLKIKLDYDNQLNAFRDWELEQRERDLEAERMREDERRLTEEYGDAWTLDQIREEVLKKSYARAIATGDYKSGRETIYAEVSAKKVLLDARKVALLEKKAAAYDQVKAAAATPGGLTQETLTKIERELKLL